MMKKNADTLFVNGRIYTVDSLGTVGEAMAVRDGKIKAVGKMAEIMESYSSDSVVDLQGATLGEILM